MKALNPASVTATFVSAVLSLILPESAMSAEHAVQLHLDPAPAYEPSNGRDRVDAFRDDPILNSRWGPGDPDLAVAKFHFQLGSTRAAMPPDPLETRDKPGRDHEISPPR
jgi:hypothetical protein